MNVPVYYKHLKFFGRTAPFLLRKMVSEILFSSQFFLPRKQPLVATLSKTRPLISKRYVLSRVEL